jgi:hypothetical protein
VCCFWSGTEKVGDCSLLIETLRKYCDLRGWERPRAVSRLEERHVILLRGWFLVNWPYIFRALNTVAAYLDKGGWEAPKGALNLLDFPDIEGEVGVDARTQEDPLAVEILESEEFPIVFECGGLLGWAAVCARFGRTPSKESVKELIENLGRFSWWMRARGIRSMRRSVDHTYRAYIEYFDHNWEDLVEVFCRLPLELFA